MKFLKASKNPIKDIRKVSYEGQKPSMRRYMPGLENFFQQIPKRITNERHVAVTRYWLDLIARILLSFKRDLIMLHVNPKSFKRTILALEKPKKLKSGEYKAGSEIIVAHWGAGFTSPVHGHKPGYLYERLLTGKVILNSFRLMGDGMVRPTVSVLHGPGMVTDEFIPDKTEERKFFIHNYEVIEQSTSLHILSEFNRDGRDNTFKVEYFEDLFTIEPRSIKRSDIAKLPVGSVVAVRSSNAPEYGDHYIVMNKDSHLIIKSNIKAFGKSTAKDIFFLLNSTDQHHFHIFHNIITKDGIVIPSNS
jgi:hypothetical protein